MKRRLVALRPFVLGLAAVLGAQSMLPVALASATTPSPAPSIVPAAAAAASALIARLPSMALPPDDRLSADAGLTVSDAPPALGPIDLGAVVEDGFATADAMPAEEWTLPDLEWSLQGDPNAAFAFVRDRIGYEPYAGVLRGAEGTLSARSGNAYDRALLLKTLLDSMLVPTRFAYASLDAATAQRLVARSVTAPSVPLQAPGTAALTPLDPGVVVARAQRDYARLRLALGPRIDAMGSSSSDQALAEASRHVWVQVALGPTWVDFDPSLPDAMPGTALMPASLTFDEIPTQARQTVDVEVIARIAAAGAITESSVLTHRFDAADSASKEIFLYFQPDLSGLGGSIVSTLTGVKQFQAVLLIDGRGESGGSFVVNAAGTDLFGEPSGDAAQLAGLSIRITRQAPGEAPESTDKVLLDRVPASLHGSASVAVDQLLPFAGDDGGPYALQQIHHVVISNGGANARDHAAQRAAVAEFVGAELLDVETAGSHPLPDLLWPMAVADKVLALASERAIVAGLSDRPDVRGIVATPRVYVTSVGVDPTSPDELQFTTDLTLDGMRILSPTPLTPGQEAKYQMWYGALQTALESEFGRGLAGVLKPDSRRMAGVSFSMSSGSTLAVLDRDAPPATAPPALTDAITRGSVVVVPGDPANATVWWTVAPSGETRSILDPGLGGGGYYGGPGNNYTNASSGGPRYVIDPNTGNTVGEIRDGKFVRYGKGGAPPSRCGGGQEYVTILGCVSIPMAWALRLGLAIVLDAVIGMAIYALARAI